MILLGISRELQFRVCNHEALHANPRTKKEREPFYTGEKESGRARVNSVYLFIGSILDRKGVFLLPV